MVFSWGIQKKHQKFAISMGSWCIFLLKKKIYNFVCVRNFEIFRSTHAYSTGRIYVLEGTLDNMFRLFGKLLYIAKTYKKIRQETPRV